MSDDQARNESEVPEPTDSPQDEAAITEANAVADAASDALAGRSVNVEVSAAALESAVTQLRRLTTLREQELIRQQEAVATMRGMMEQQRRSTRLGLLAMFLVLAVGIAGLGVLMVLREHNREVDEELHILSSRVAAAGAAMETTAEHTQAEIRQLSKDQGGRLEAMAGVVKDSRDAHVKMARKIEANVSEARDLLAKASNEQTLLKSSVERKMEDSKQELAKTRGAIVERMDESAKALRAERDQVQAEVNALLEKKMSLLSQREVELERERVALGELADRAREETRGVIAEAMLRLSELEGAPKIRVQDDAEDDPVEEQPVEEQPVEGEPAADAEDGDAPSEDEAEADDASLTATGLLMGQDAGAVL